jgi:proline iminopeptidase
MKNKSLLWKCLLTGVLLSMATLLAAGVWFWRVMGQPLYEPGMVRSGSDQLRGPLEPPEQLPDQERWLVERDIEINHWSAGSGTPVLVLHGGPGYPLPATPAGFAPLLDRYRFHFYDQRGCGDSTRPFDRFERKNYYSNMVELERTLGIGAQIADIERIRRIERQERLILIGHSFGAFLSTMYAAEFPERVAALVLVAPSGVLVLPNEQGDFFEEIRSRLAAEQRPKYDAFLKSYLDFGTLFEKSEGDLAAMNRKVGDYFLAACGSGDVVAPRPLPRNGGWMVQAMYLSMGRQHDYRRALATITAPTLVIHGQRDIVPVAVSRTYAEGIFGARFVVLPAAQNQGVDHFPFADETVGFGQAVGEFLDSVANDLGSKREHEKEKDVARKARR